MLHNTRIRVFFDKNSFYSKFLLDIFLFFPYIYHSDMICDTDIKNVDLQIEGQVR